MDGDLSNPGALDRLLLRYQHSFLCVTLDPKCSGGEEHSGLSHERCLPEEEILPYLLAALGGRAEDGQLRPAGSGFGRLAGVEEGLDERVQVLSFLKEENKTTSSVTKQANQPCFPTQRSEVRRSLHLMLNL